MQRTIRIERLLPYPQELVWHALTTHEVLSRWFMPTDDFAPVVGHEFSFRMKPQRGWDGITYCQVLDVEPLHRIRYSYRGRATGEKTLACAGIDSEIAKSAGKSVFTELDTVLSFTLTPEYNCSSVEQTRLLLEHSGFKGPKLMLVSLVLAHGWRSRVLPRLCAALDGPVSSSEKISV
jgi:uncharacterized protein YndB with AHSA1/START domain